VVVEEEEVGVDMALVRGDRNDRKRRVASAIIDRGLLRILRGGKYIIVYDLVNIMLM